MNIDILKVLKDIESGDAVDAIKWINGQNGQERIPVKDRKNDELDNTAASKGKAAD